MKELVSLVLSKNATVGAWNAMMTTNVVGRVEIRKQKIVVQALKKDALKQADPNDEDKGYKYLGGTIKITEEALDFLSDSVDKILAAGMKGELTIAYGELTEALDPHYPESKDK